LPVFSQLDEELYEEEYYFDDIEDYYVIPKISLFELDFKTNIPQGAFRTVRNERLFYATSFSYLKQLREKKPLFFRGEIGFSFLGRYAARVIRNIDLTISEWNAATSSHALHFFAGVRYYPTQLGFGKFDPFFEASLGLNWFYTLTNYRFGNSDEVETRIENSSANLGLLTSAGLNYRMSPDLFLKFKISYMQAPAVKHFIKLEEFTIGESTSDAFEEVRTPTDFIAISLGVSYRF
jgi:opacity protein-like surface antigen